METGLEKTGVIRSAQGTWARPGEPPSAGARCRWLGRQGGEQSELGREEERGELGADVRKGFFPSETAPRVEGVLAGVLMQSCWTRSRSCRMWGRYERRPS